MNALISKASLPFLLCSVFSFVLLAACGGGGEGDEDSGDRSADAGQDTGECAQGSTQACTCTDGAAGAQTCDGEGFGACVCDGTPLCTDGETQQCGCPDGSLGAQICGNESWSACECEEPKPELPVHGDLCFAPDYDCGAGTGLVCVFEQGGDTQGVCRAVCNSFSECLQNDEAIGRFETDCCDITNGSRVCVDESSYPGATCY